MRIVEVACPVPVHKPFHYSLPPGLAVSAGERVKIPFGPRRLVGTVLSVFEGEPERPLKPVEAVVSGEPRLSAEMIECARWLSARYCSPIGECVKALAPSYVSLKREPKKAPERSVPAALASSAPSFELTAAQSAALAALSGKVAKRELSVSLLYGVPASGKTEVYLRLIRQVVGEGGQSLFLVPEIALTTPFFREFSASLAVPVVLWHSELTPRQRREAWLGIKAGSVKVAVGARSAALLPFVDLRLAVLDEEQDESFKQDVHEPQYHAREVVLRRARRFEAAVILGSATPSLESWRMGQSGEAATVLMPDRVTSVARPSVGVLPLPEPGRCLSDTLLGKLRERLSRGEQAILLVNRRGFSTLVMCLKCGWVDRCADCGVARIQHEQDDGFSLRCHHCSAKAPMPAACPKCANPALRVTGTGTQKVVAELKRRLPGARVLRMDRDALDQERKEDLKLYERFRAREADVLVGTKLVAKSYHFPEVTLVGVVDADTMLHMPDFRAAERTMQLLAQVAGRSGRAEKAGEVWLQTLNPDHAAIEKTVAGDYAAFADKELETRRFLGYPPFSSLVRLVWAGADESKTAAAAEEEAARLRQELSAAGAEIVGPAPAVIRQAAGKFRYHLIVKAPPEALERVLESARRCSTPAGIKLKVHVDPYDFF